MTDAIFIDKLSFGYSGKRKVLEDVSFSLKQGQFVGLIGPNGGGKTTLMKIILGLLKHYRGTVQIFGHPPDSRQARRHIGYVPQIVRFSQDFPATVQDVICMASYRDSRFAFLRKPDKRLMETAAMLGLEDLLDRPVGEISGGQLRRVLMARALMTKPDLLILDEPIAGVDSSGQIIFFEFLTHLKKEQNVSILVSSHEIDSLRANADSIVCLNRTVHFCDSANLVTDQLISHTYECELETFYHNRHFHLLKDKHHACHDEH